MDVEEVVQVPLVHLLGVEAAVVAELVEERVEELFFRHLDVRVRDPRDRHLG